jgi:hypothetical protein
LVGMHWTQFTDSYGASHYGPYNTGFPTSESMQVNAWRTHGNHEIGFWDVTEASQGVYTWTHWDKAETFWAHNNINNVYVVLQGVPSFYQTRANGSDGAWSMQLPSSQTALNNYLNALFTRYTRLICVEIGNEWYTGTVGRDTNGGITEGAVMNGSWSGTIAELRTLSSWVLDWRNTFNAAHPGRNIMVQSPSVSDQVAHAQALLNWLDTYTRGNEFDSYSAHAYNWYENTMQNSGSSVSVLRAGVTARYGASKIVRDGEHGFNPSVPATADRIYNMAVRAAIMGLDGIDFFSYGILNNSGVEGQCGEPWNFPLIKGAYEDAALLAGTTITKVMTGTGGRWRVEGLTNTPGSGGGGGGGSTAVSPVYVSNGTSSYGSSGTAVGVMPGGVSNGDLLLLTVTMDDNVNASPVTINTPAGWTLIKSDTTGAGTEHIRTSVYTRTAASEPASYNITFSGTTPWNALISRITGLTGTPSTDATPTSAVGTGANFNAPAITTVTTNTLLVAIGSQTQGGGSTWGTPPGGWTLAYQEYLSKPANLAVMYREVTSAGVQTATPFTVDGSGTDYYVAITCAFKS